MGKKKAKELLLLKYDVSVKYFAAILKILYPYFVYPSFVICGKLKLLLTWSNFEKISAY